MKDFKKSKNPNWGGGKDCICEICGKLHYRIPIRLINSKHFYCSVECSTQGMSLYPARPKNGEYKTCPICKEAFYVMPGQLNKRKYCSYKCSYKAKENHPILICKVCGKEYRTYYSHVKWRGSSYCSKKCHDKGASIFKTGENSPSWKGGISFLNNRIRKTIEWKTWRKQVYERDNYTCQICGNKSKKDGSIELHPHHIKSYKDFHSLRFDINNGQTLCSDCHYQLHGILSEGRKRINVVYKKIEKICQGCDEKFMSKRNNHIYCSHRCEERVRRKLRKNAEAHKELSEIF
jgi:hypothetical protein